MFGLLNQRDGQITSLGVTATGESHSYLLTPAHEWCTSSPRGLNRSESVSRVPLGKRAPLSREQFFLELLQFKLGTVPFSCAVRKHRLVGKRGSIPGLSAMRTLARNGLRGNQSMMSAKPTSGPPGSP